MRVTGFAAAGSVPSGRRVKSRRSRISTRAPWLLPILLPSHWTTP